jgi:Domain of unknown function (DUF4340)
MSPKKLIALSAVVVVLFGFILLFERKLPTTEERSRKGDLYWDIPQDRIQRIEVVRGAETLEFQRTGEIGWRMLRPEKYPADTLAVGSLVTELAEMKRAAGEEPPDVRASDYGFDKPSAKATIVWNESPDAKNAKTRVVEFGAAVPGTDVVAARVEGSPKVLFVPSSVLESLKKSADEFESREVFGSAASDAARLEILRGRGKLAFVKKDGVWWLAEPMSDYADSAEIDRFTGALAGLRVREFLHGPQDLAALGLDPPLFHVALTGAKNAMTAADFGATRSDGNTLYARRDGQVLTVDHDIVDELSKEAEAFRSRNLLGFRRSDVAGVDAVFPKASYALAQRDGGWTAAGKPLLAASADDALTALLDLRSKDFLEPSQVTGVGPAAATVTVRLTSGAPWVLTLYERGAERIARVAPRPGAFAVDGDTADKLEAAFRKATTPPPTPAAATPAGTPGSGKSGKP